MGFDTARASDRAVVIGKLDLATMKRRHAVKPGDRIPVVIDGRTYETIIDNHGVQRFVQSTVNKYMFAHDSKGDEIDFSAPGAGTKSPMADLNVMVRAYHAGKFTERDWMEFVMQGYSVSGFLDLSEFRDWTIYNPLWDEGCIEIDASAGTISIAREHA